MGSNSTEAKFSLACGDSQIPFNRVIIQCDLVYWQYCLLWHPNIYGKRILHSHFASLIVWSFFTKGRGFSVVISTALQGAALGAVGECLIVSSIGVKHSQCMQLALLYYFI